MIDVEKNRFQTLSPEVGARFVVAAEAALADMDLFTPFAPAVLSGLHRAIERRADSGLTVDPTSRAEVTGLVRAVMAAEEIDHVHSVGVELHRYVVGYT